MAFKDITKVMYEGKVKLDYKDKAHRYYIRPRVDWDLPETDAKAWGKIIYPKGVTTMIGDTLEKKGLMTWPLGLALGELFGFYDFINEKDEKLVGFSKDKGTLWGKEGSLLSLNKEAALPLIQSAHKAWTRKKKKGADIGSVVHDAIEHLIKGEPFDIAEQYMWTIKDTYPMPDGDEPDMFEADRTRALEEFKEDVAMATLAFKQVENWWLKTKPELFGAEDILYSLEENVAGTYDLDMGLLTKFHPRPEMFKGKKQLRITSDFKTSNASKSKEAAMPEGISYDYFVQMGMYEMMRREMGLEPCDDLAGISARKDGGFGLIFASELGLTVDECMSWAKCVITANRLRERARAGLVAHAEPNLSNKEAF